MKLFIFILVVTLVSDSFAQTFGVKAGLNLSNQISKSNNYTFSDDYKMNPGFHIGATAEFTISHFISIETAMLITTKGYKMSIGDSTFEFKVNSNLFYLDIPLTAKVTFGVGAVEICGVFGPYLGIGLSGKDKIEQTIQGETETFNETIKWGSDQEHDYRRLDFGLTMGVVVEINSIQIGLSYGLGLANISSYTFNGHDEYNRVIGLSVGYKFRK